MALPLEIDPFGPAIPPPDVPTWAGPVPLPPEWGPLDIPPVAPPTEQAAVAPPQEQGALQPGLGIPAATLEQAAPAPPESGSWFTPPGFDAQLEVPPPPEAPPDQGLFHDLGPRQFGEPDRQNAWDLSANPLDVLQAEQTIEGSRQQLGRDERQQAYDRDHELAIANQKAFNDATAATKQALAEVDADAKKAAAEKVGWASKSAPQKLAGVIAAVVGGLVQSRTGGARNTGMDMVDKIIEGELAEHHTKMAELADKRRGVVAQFGQNFDQFKAQEVLRQAMYEQSARQVEQDMANYDPRGTKFVQLAKFAGDLRAKAAAAQQKFAAEDFERRLKVMKFGLEERTQTSKEKQDRQSNALGWANNANARARLDYDKTKDARDFGLKEREVTAKEAELRQKQAEATEKADRELGIGGEVHTTMVKQQVPDPVTGKLVEREVPVVRVDQLRQPDGSVYHAPEHAQQPLIKQRTGTQDLVNSLAELKQLRARAGGADKYTSPGDQAEYEQLTNRAVIAYATSKGLSLADKQSTDFARNAILGGDPSNYRAGDVEKRIESAIVDGTRSYHNALRGNGYDGKLPSFDRPARAADLSSAEGASKEVQQGKTPVEAARDTEPGFISNAIEPWTKSAIGPGLTPGKSASEQNAEAAFEAGSPDIPGLSKEQAKGVKSLLAQSRDKDLDDKAINAARQELVNLATVPDREALHSPILKVLEDQAPDLFDVALAKLPKDERDYWSGYAAIRRRGAK